MAQHRIARAAAFAAVGLACSVKEPPVPTTAARIVLTSSAFEPGGAIPAVHSCLGKDVSPPLRWSDVPPTARSLALICDDPDAPMRTWVHWVAFGIPPASSSLGEGILPADTVATTGGAQGKNSWGNLGYGGPCPPSGTHRYFFKLYALDVETSLPPGATKEELLRAMEGHIVGYGELMGTFRKGA